MSKSKINLDVLKRLVSELETSLTQAESIAKAEKLDYVVEMSKASGLAAGILTEAGLLMQDIQFLVTGANGPPSNKQELLEKLLGGFKMPGSSN
ncbi:MAG TPA: hypothetical protein VII94_06235 [Candidatus Saccharimonadales bacterium]